MSGPCVLRVYDQNRLVHEMECAGVVELGRQREGELPPYHHAHHKRPPSNHPRLRGWPAGGVWRVVLVPLEVKTTSRTHLWIEPLPDCRVRLSNLSAEHPVRLADGEEIPPNGSREMALPLALDVGPRRVSLGSVEGDAAAGPLQSLRDVPPLPGSVVSDCALFNTVAAAGVMPGESLVRWLQAAMDVLQGAGGSRAFLERAAGALVDLVGLDAGRVLLRGRGGWRVEAEKTVPRPVPQSWRPSRRILDSLLAEKKTVWHVPAATTDSLQGLKALVAAPILDRGGEVVGALYGDRGREDSGRASGRPIGELEAMLVEVLAGGVAAGLARIEQEEMRRDLEEGRKIQEHLLPKTLPRADGWELAQGFRPAREVSGDFYDVFELPHGHLALVVADVCNKGVGPALYAAQVHTLLRLFARQAFEKGPTDPAGEAALAAVRQANDYLARAHADDVMFVTLFFGILDTGSGELAYVNAGHLDPLVVGSSGVRPLPPPPRRNRAVGTTPQFPWDLNRAVLAPGETLFAYTDGVSDATDVAMQPFGNDRLHAALARPAPSAAALLASVETALEAHAAGTEPVDDVTMLVVRRQC